MVLPLKTGCARRQDEIRHTVAKKEALRSEQEAFLQPVIEGTAVPITGEDGLEALALAKTIVRSGTEHRIITL
jgi:predicted dehydrogenase